MFNKKKKIETSEVEIIAKKENKAEYGDEILPLAGRPFFEMYGFHIDQSKKWKSVTFAALAIAAFAVVWAAKVSTGIKYIPVVIEQNDVGSLTPLGVLNVRNLKVNETIIVSQIGTYIQDLRSVIQDVPLEQNRGQQISLMTADTDKDKMQDLFIKQLKDSGKDTISVNITQIMPLKVAKANTWKVAWNETFATNPNDIRRYEAIFNITLKDLNTNNPEEIMLNPTGIQISNFTMSEVFSQKNNSN